MYGEQYPDVTPDELTVIYWTEAGMCGQDMNGFVPLSWIELDAFNRLMGYDLDAVELHCIRDMSGAYANARRDDNPLSISPMERKYD